MSDDFTSQFMKGARHYDEGYELDEEKESEAFVRGFKARQVEDEINSGEKKNE